jgi:hypothetical protein
LRDRYFDHIAAWTKRMCDCCNQSMGANDAACKLCTGGVIALAFIAALCAEEAQGEWRAKLVYPPEPEEVMDRLMHPPEPAHAQ